MTRRRLFRGSGARSRYRTWGRLRNTSPRALAARDGAGQTDSDQFPGLLVASLTDGGRAYQPVHSLASAALSSAARFLNLPCL